MLINNIVTIYSTDVNNMKTMSAYWELFFSFFSLIIHFLRKLAKKRKETLSSTRQEMTVMVNSMDKSYTEQGTNCDEAFSFMDTHNLNGRCKFFSFLSFSSSFFFLKVKGRCKWFLKYSSLLSHGKSMGPRVSHCAAHYGVYSNEQDSQTSSIDFFKNNKDNWAFFCPSFSSAEEQWHYWKSSFTFLQSPLCWKFYISHAVPSPSNAFLVHVLTV